MHYKELKQAWAELTAKGWSILETSAKTGDHVEEAFLTLTSRILEVQNVPSDEDDD